MRAHVCPGRLGTVRRSHSFFERRRKQKMNTSLHQPSLQHRPWSRLLLIGPYLRKASFGFAGLLIVVGLLLVGCGTSTTSSPTSGNSSAKPARSFAGLVDIGGGRKMYLNCRGSGPPTVALVWCRSVRVH